MSDLPPFSPGNAVTTQRQFLVGVEGIPDLWASKSGGETSADTSDVWDGGRKYPEKSAAPATTENITIGRPYRAGRDAPIIKALRPRVGVFRTTVSVQPTDADLVPIGSPTVYANALLIRVAEAEFDASSGDPGAVELEFAVESVA